jgi:MFS family permease
MPIPSTAPRPFPLASTAAPSPLASAAFRRLVYTQACFGVAYSTFMILPKYLVTHGVPPGRMGLVMGSAALANVAGAPLVGWLCHRLPARTALMLASATMVLGAAGFAAFDPAQGGPAPYLFRAVQGLAWALAFSSASLLAMRLAPRGRLGEALALQSSANLASNALGPALAEPALAALGPRPVFLTAAIMAAVAVRLAATLEPDPAPVTGAGRGRGQRPAGALLAISVILGIACGAMLTFSQPLALARGVHRVSDFLVAYTAGALLARVGLGRLSDRLGAGRVGFASFLAYGVVVAAMPALAPGCWWTSLAMFGALFGLTHGLFWPAYLTLALSDGAGAGGGGRERLLSWINAGFNAGLACVGALGALAEHAGWSVLFIPVGALTAASALLLRRWAGPRAAPSTKPVTR